MLFGACKFNEGEVTAFYSASSHLSLSYSVGRILYPRLFFWHWDLGGNLRVSFMNGTGFRGWAGWNQRAGG
jgi:hypothetical protein